MLKLCSVKAFLFILVWESTIPKVWGQTAAKAASGSPITFSNIENIFGKGFKEETPSKFGDSVTYRYRHKDYTIQITVQPSYGAKSVNEYRKMSSPAGVTWQPIPNDPDGAVVEVRDDSKDDLAATPTIEYIRKDKHVRLQVLGNYYGFDKRNMPKKREQMRQKLAKLKRIP